jgi:hypothetical protein
VLGVRGGISVPTKEKKYRAIVGRNAELYDKGTKSCWGNISAIWESTRLGHQSLFYAYTATRKDARRADWVMYYIELNQWFDTAKRFN